jgi:hypothetical protein
MTWRGYILIDDWPAGWDNDQLAVTTLKRTVDRAPAVRP